MAEVRNRRKISFEVSAEAGDLLDDGVKKSGKTLSENIRTGLALYAIFTDEIEAGNTIGIIQKSTGEVVKEIVLP